MNWERIIIVAIVTIGMAATLRFATQVGIQRSIDERAIVEACLKSGRDCKVGDK